MELIYILLRFFSAAVLSLIPVGRRFAPAVTILGSLKVFLLSLQTALPTATGVEMIAISDYLSCDSFSGLILLLVAFVGLTAAILSWGYIATTVEATDDKKIRQIQPIPAFHAVLVMNKKEFSMRTVLILGFVSLLTDISSEMVYPLLALYLTTTLGTTPAIVGIIEGIAESLASLLKTYSGYVSDKVQRRKPLAILGYGSATIGRIFLYLSTSWTWVLWGRVIDRFGKGMRTAPRDALIAEASAEGRLGHSFGLHRALDTFGAVVGIAIAYFLFTATRGEYTRIFLYSIIPGIIGVLLLFTVKEKKPKIKLMKLHPLAAWQNLSPRFKAFFLVAFLFTLGNSSNQFLLLRANNLGFKAADVILLYLLYNIVYALSAYPAGRLSDHIGRRTLLVCGYLFYGLVYLGFSMASESVHVWGLFGIYGLYSGLTEGVEKALVAELCPAESKATMLGIHATLVGIGLLPASVAGGLLWRMISPEATFYFGGAVGVLSAIGMYLVVPKLTMASCPK